MTINFMQDFEGGEWRATVVGDYKHTSVLPGLIVTFSFREGYWQYRTSRGVDHSTTSLKEALSVRWSWSGDGTCRR